MNFDVHEARRAAMRRDQAMTPGDVDGPDGIRLPEVYVPHPRPQGDALDYVGDIAKARKVMEYLTAHPETWHQGTWARLVERDGGPDVVDLIRENHGALAEPLTAEQTGNVCDTAFCLAGHVAVADGLKFRWGAIDATTVLTPDGVETLVEDYAREALKLSELQADLLFFGDNSLLTLWRLWALLTDGEIQVPESVREHHDELRGRGSVDLSDTDRRFLDQYSGVDDDAFQVMIEHRVDRRLAQNDADHWHDWAVALYDAAVALRGQAPATP